MARLQTGVVDGQENTWSNIYGKKFFEVQDGITETNHGIIDYLVVTSTEWWDGLDPAVRDQFPKILDEVTANAKRGIRRRSMRPTRQRSSKPAARCARSRPSSAPPGSRRCARCGANSKRTSAATS